VRPRHQARQEIRGNMGTRAARFETSQKSSPGHSGWCHELFSDVLKGLIDRPDSGDLDLALDEATFYGDHYCVRAVVCVQLGKNAAHVPLDGVLRDLEMVGDHFVGTALSNHAQHLDFAQRQCVRSQMTG